MSSIPKYLIFKPWSGIVQNQGEGEGEGGITGAIKEEI